MKIIKIIALSTIASLSLYGIAVYAEEQKPVAKPEIKKDEAQQTWAEYLAALASQAQEKAQTLYAEYGKPVAEYAIEEGAEALKYAQEKGGQTYEASKKLASKIYEAAVDYAAKAYEGAKTLNGIYQTKGSSEAAKWLKDQGLNSTIAITEALKEQVSDAGESLKAHAKTLYESAQTEAPKLAKQLKDVTSEYAQLGANKTAQYYAVYEPKISALAQQLSDVVKNKSDVAAQQIKKTANDITEASKAQVFQVYEFTKNAAVQVAHQASEALKRFEEEQEQEEKPVLQPGPVIIVDK